ncbi:MAG: SDR family NAD(P)-dependent oxidoreductase, partial [Rhizobium giardinii]
MTQEIQGKALITGASAGIGAIYADRLARRGYDLLLVARNETRLGELAKRISEHTGRKVDTLTADLNDKSDLRRVEMVLRADDRITMLVNNAGVGASSPLLTSDVDAMERMISLNVTALTRLTYAAVPRFVARGSGTIINIASVVAVAPEVLNGVYGATKAFVVAFS